jgi:chromate transport protein ChrA
MDAYSKFITPGAIFLVTLASGIWLSSVGRPYNGALFNVHKLIALGTVIFAGLQIAKALPKTGTQTLIILLLVFAALCVIALFATGALMSLGKLDYNLMHTVHRIAPVLVAIVTIYAVHLLVGRLQ